MARYRRGPRLAHSAECVSAIAERYASGVSLDDLGLEYGVSGQCVGNRLREAGIKLRGRGGSLSDALRFVPHRDRTWRPDGDGAAA